MNIIVTYKSKTGFTAQYAQWIARELGCQAVELGGVKNLGDYDLVIHGGWIMGATICGAQNVIGSKCRSLVLFGVGYTEGSDYSDVLKKAGNLQDYPVFYFRGGFHKDKMNFFMKAMVKMVTKKAVKDADYSSVEQIKSLIDFVKN